MPKIVDHNRYRRELLQRALAIFAEQGYGAITMRQIAKRLGVSTGTLYHYFPSKEGLFMQLVQELCERDITDFFDQAPVAAAVGDRLRAVVAFYLENFRFYQQQLLLWVDFHQHRQRAAPDEQPFLQGFWQRTRDRLASYLQLPNPAHVDFVLVFMDGLLLQFLYHRGEIESDWLTQQMEVLVALIDAH
ncbi:MAG: TetR/AcrR family transcriptional regulator [Leptolyngbya sp. SIO4C1]|nr:TetR/AcrR family transcriptional regulator [Leptolyngbya sp. SIO4C1]